MEEFVPLLFAFIGLSIFCTLIDVVVKVLENIMKIIPHLPDQFETPIAYVIIVIISYITCSQANFDFFKYININFNYNWQGWLYTSLIISGGSAVIRQGYDLMNNIPTNIGGLTSAMTRIILPIKNKEENK